MRDQAGFTLIELAIVIAVIALLAPIAVQAYRDYTVRPRRAEGINLAAGAKDSAIEIAGNGDPTFDSGYTRPAPTNDVSSLLITPATGAMTITYTARAGGGTVAFTPSPAPVPGVPPDINVKWTCSGTTLAQKFRPAECRP